MVKNRPRSSSDATEVPEDVVGKVGADMVVEGFSQVIKFDDVSFSSVKIFHPRKGIHMGIIL